MCDHLTHVARKLKASRYNEAVNRIFLHIALHVRDMRAKNLLVDGISPRLVLAYGDATFPDVRYVCVRERERDFFDMTILTSFLFQGRSKL